MTVGTGPARVPRAERGSPLWRFSAPNSGPAWNWCCELVDFDERLSRADLVVTGEGALDEQTLHGKAPAGVAAAARAAGVPVVAVCGRNQLSADSLHRAGIAAAYSLTDIEPDVARCIAEPAPLPVRLGESIATDHLSGEGRPKRNRGRRQEA